MIGALLGFWTGLPKWAQDALKWIGIGFVVFLAGKAIAETLKAEGARKQREKNEREALEEQARVSEMRRKITQENQDAITRADEAVADLPAYRHTDELRQQDPDLAAIVLGNRAGRSEGTEGH